MIVKRGSRWVVTSEDGGRTFGDYPSREKAEKRLAEVEMFKHMAAAGTKRKK